MTRKEVSDWLELKVSSSDKMLNDMIKESSEKVAELCAVSPEILEGGDAPASGSFARLKKIELDDYLNGIKSRLED